MPRIVIDVTRSTPAMVGELEATAALDQHLMRFVGIESKIIPGRPGRDVIELCRDGGSP